MSIVHTLLIAVISVGVWRFLSGSRCCAVWWAWLSVTVSLLVPRLVDTRVRSGLGLGSACQEIASVITKVHMKFNSICAQPLCCSAVHLLSASKYDDRMNYF